MSEDKSILKQLDDFNKILDDLENIEVELAEEDRALILLAALPKSMENFKDTLLFGSRETISLEDVQMALKCKELQKNAEAGLSSKAGEGLHIKKDNNQKKQTKKPQPKGNQKYEKKSGEGPSNPDLKCFHRQEPGHFKKQCIKWQQMMAKYAQEDAKKAGKSQVNQTSTLPETSYDPCESLCITVIE